MGTFVDEFDCLLLDLDGTVFRGHEPTEGAVAALSDAGIRALYVTNNASRSASEVADHLRRMGFCARPDDVVTSAQSAAHLLAAQLPTDSPVLVVGTDSLADEVAAVGLRPVRRFGDGPVAVVQGFAPSICWADLAEAGLAIRSGAVWVATNLDKTLPSERGLLPGNGSMVAALRAATDSDPQVAGKPAPQLMSDALSRGDFRAPLVVGDRLDTDIAGADAAALPSLMVLCGVNSARDMVFAPPDQRPTYVGCDLRTLHTDTGSAAIVAQSAWRVGLDGGRVVVSAAGSDDVDGLSVVRAVAAAVWQVDGFQPEVCAADDTARTALQRWSLL